MYDIAVIGGGIIGTSIIRELSKYNLKTILIEKSSDISNGTTKANSAIIHGGYDAKEGTLMAKFNTLGNPMFEKLCKDLDVHFKKIGSLVVAFSEDEKVVLKELYDRGIKNGIPDMEIIDQKRLRELEPNISEEGVGALLSKTAGIVDPWGLAIALAENAATNGAEIKMDTEVIDIKKEEEIFKIITKKGGEFKSKYIINAAGLYADKINEMLNKSSFKINPKRGEYYIMDKDLGTLVNHVIFQCPTNEGKGVLVAPTVHGNLLIGPDSEYVNDREETSTTEKQLEYVSKTALKTSEMINFRKTITTFAGLRAEPDTGDFIIGESETKGFVNIAGIKSPGLSAAPAIAKHVVGLLDEINGGFEENIEFDPKRKQLKFIELTDEEKAEVIKKDPRYGRIICRCENITEGEIVDIINRPVGATTVDGVKKRCRPGMGRCQGGFCGPRIQEILARELKLDMKEVLKDEEGSYILTEKTKDC